MTKQNTVLPVLVVFVVIAAGGQAAELPNHLKEDTISKDLYEPSAPLVSAAAAAKNTIVSVPPGSANPSSKILSAVAGDSTAAAAAGAHGKDSATVVESAAAVKDSVIANGGNPNEAVVYAPENSNNNNNNNNNNNDKKSNDDADDSNNEQRQAKLLKLNEKLPSISSQTAHSEKADNNEHSVGERIEKVMPVKENTVATQAGKGGSSSSLKVAAQMVGVYQHNKR